MEPSTFEASLQQSAPPAGLSPLLESMWWAGHGNWTRAHEIAQSIETPKAAWVHAYLHRLEGDRTNAEYWYRRAGRPFSPVSLRDEWREIVASLFVLDRSTTMAGN